MQIIMKFEATWEDLWFKFTGVVPSLIALFSVEWMISIKLFKVVANVGNPPFCSSIIAVPSGPKSHTITVILAVVAPQPRWRHKPWKWVLSLEGTFWLILLCLMRLFTIWYSQAKVTGSQHNSTPTPKKLMEYNPFPLFPPYPSATFLSSYMSPYLCYAV